MLFPYRDNNPAKRMPVVTWGLIGINLIAFLTYAPILTIPWEIRAFWSSWALQPVEFISGHQPYTLLTSMFLHAGYLHIGGNLLFLWIFGDNVEDMLGHVGFLLFYLLCGLAAGISQLGSDPYSNVPIIGASGAVAGVMGAYLVLFPQAKVHVFLFLLIYMRRLLFPAWLFLGFWACLQLFGGVSDPGNGAGIAYWAHIGGFLVGIVYALPFKLRQLRRQRKERMRARNVWHRSREGGSRVPTVRRRK